MKDNIFNMLAREAHELATELAQSTDYESAGLVLRVALMIPRVKNDPPLARMAVELILEAKSESNFTRHKKRLEDFAFSVENGLKERPVMFKRPKALMFAQPMAFQIDHLYFAHTRPEAESRKRDDFYNPLGLPTLFGFVLPRFQRDLVWTDDQKSALIRSVWLNIPIGTYAVNFSLSSRELPAPVRNILLDGQQRLNALRSFWDDEFAFDGYYWSQIPDIDKRYFVRMSFPQMRTDSRSEAECIEYYNALNFGGTAHTEEDRA